MEASGPPRGPVGAVDVPGDLRPPAVPDAGRDALLLIGSRVAGLYLAGVAVAVLLGPPGPHWSLRLGSTAVLAVTAAGVVTALSRPVGPGTALLFAVSAAAGELALAGWHPTLAGHDVQILLGSAASAAAGGAALAWGPTTGLLAATWVLGVWAGPVRLVGGGVDGPLFAGAIAGGVMGATASVLLRRGYTLTQRALAAAEEAVVARAVAAARWRARRSEIRTLHDTVLSTLSLLAQGGRGVDEEALRDDCRVQAGVLREADVRASAGPLGDHPDVATPPDGALSPIRAMLLDRSAAADGDADPFDVLTQRLAARSLDVHVYGTAEARRMAGLSPAVAASLLAAVEECLENVRRHAGVGVASISVTCAEGQLRCMVTDEGRGFDARDTSIRRIGLGDSVLGRIEDQGGEVRIWSAPGQGTSVALSVPLCDGSDGGVPA